MPYESVIDATHILRSTLYLQENTDFPEKNSQTIADVTKQLRAAIMDLEVAQHRLDSDRHTD